MFRSFGVSFCFVSLACYYNLVISRPLYMWEEWQYAWNLMFVITLRSFCNEQADTHLPCDVDIPMRILTSYCLVDVHRVSRQRLSFSRKLSYSLLSRSSQYLDTSRPLSQHMLIMINLQNQCDHLKWRGLWQASLPTPTELGLWFWLEGKFLHA